MTTTPAEQLQPGDVIDTEPLYEYFDQNGYEYNPADRMSAEAELETVESITTTDTNVIIITTDSVFYAVPSTHPVTVTTHQEN